MNRRHLLGLGAAALAAALGAGCGPVTIEKPPPVRVYEAGKIKPRLYVLPLEDRSGGKINQGSLFLCKVQPGTEQKLRSHVAEIARSSGLFTEVQEVSWSEADIQKRRAETKAEGDEIVLYPTLNAFSADGRPTVAAYILAPIVYLFAAFALPAVPYEWESELSMSARLADVKTGKLIVLHDSGKITFNDSGPLSYSNSPGHLRNSMEVPARNFGTGFAASLEGIRRLGAAPPPTAPVPVDPATQEKPPVKELLRWPSDVTSPTAEIRLLTPPSGLAVRNITVTINGQPGNARVRTEEGAIVFQIDIGKGSNEIALEVLYLSGERDVVNISIKRHR